MKKSLLIALGGILLTACTQTEYVEKECPSCNPPVRQFEVVTECSGYQDTALGGNRFAQCRYCTNKIYSNGKDVTALFMEPKTRPVNGKKMPCPYRRPRH